MLAKKCVVHFVGIGGIGMSGIAEILLNLGYEVSGSDLHESETTEHLRTLGARVSIGHGEGNLNTNPSVVVISSAVKFSNPEVVEARRRTIPVIPRAEMLAELMRMKVGIAVAGSHGKTTTTSMIAAVLGAAGLDPTLIIGGRVKSLGSNAKLGQGSFLVAEADESDGTFLHLSPTIALVTNIDREHMDFYQTLDRLRESFLEFINKVPFDGLAVLCLDDPQVRALLPKVNKRYVTYGLSPEADFYACDFQSHAMEIGFSVYAHSQLMGKLKIHMPGRHNAMNALAAVAVGEELNVPFDRTSIALEEFMGIHRRLEVTGEVAGVTVVDDYGHHPTEIQATLQAIAEGWNRPLTVIFQPHRFSRTRDLFDDFLTAFDGVARLILTEIYPAGEKEIPGVSAEGLYRAMKLRGHMEIDFIPDKGEIAKKLAPSLKAGDMVLTLGAGDIHRVGEELMGWLQR